MTNYSYGIGSEGIIKKQRARDIAKELFRKSIHICSAFIPLFLRYAYWPVIILLCLAALLYTVFEIARRNGYEIPLVSQITAAAARKRDENRFVLGPLTLVSGIVFAALLWDPSCAAVGIYALSFGDGLASLSGKLFGCVKIPGTSGKTVAGSLTCFTAIFISSFAVTSRADIALWVACAGTVIEVLPLKDFDNLIIPVVLGGFTHCLLAV